MQTSIHRKVCQTIEKMRKEKAVLAFLVNSDIREIVPKIAVADQQTDPAILGTFHVEGFALTTGSLDCKWMRRLGILAKRVHMIGDYQVFGSLDENLSIRQPTDCFSEFIERQIQKWTTWHRSAFNDAYIFAYGNWLQQSLGVVRMHLDRCHPLFCHGDFDLKNILVRSDVVTGLVDWEDAGVYCLEWELRKLSRFYHRQPEFLATFFEGYFGMVPDDHSILEQTICFMEAVDVLGHLRWCIMHNLKNEHDVTISRMHQFFQPKEVV